MRVLSSTLAALHHAHELRDVNGQPLGLVHRDVSPQNVFVTYDGQVKLLDFGIAKAASDDEVTPRPACFKGKLRYTSPGRFVGEENDRRSDLFSVGVMLWQLLTRRRLWHGMNEGAVMQELAKRSSHPGAAHRRSDHPREKLDAICNKALAVSADERFQTAAEMEEALEDYLAAESGRRHPAAPWRSSWRSDFGDKRARFRATLDEQIRVAASVPLEPQRFVSSSRLRAQGVPDLATSTGSDSISRIALSPPSSSSSFSRLRTLDGVGQRRRARGLGVDRDVGAAAGGRGAHGAAGRTGRSRAARPPLAGTARRRSHHRGGDRRGPLPPGRTSAGGDFVRGRGDGGHRGHRRHGDRHPTFRRSRVLVGGCVW